MLTALEKVTRSPSTSIQIVREALNIFITTNRH